MILTNVAYWTRNPPFLSRRRVQKIRYPGQKSCVFIDSYRYLYLPTAVLNGLLLFHQGKLLHVILPTLGLDDGYVRLLVTEKLKDLAARSWLRSRCFHQSGERVSAPNKSSELSSSTTLPLLWRLEGGIFPPLHCLHGSKWRAINCKNKIIFTRRQMAGVVPRGALPVQRTVLQGGAGWPEDGRQLCRSLQVYKVAILSDLRALKCLKISTNSKHYIWQSHSRAQRRLMKT